MTELGHNTPLGRGGLSLLTVVIILTRPVRPANVSRTDGRGCWAVVVVPGGWWAVFACFYYCTATQPGQKRPTQPHRQKWTPDPLGQFLTVFVSVFGFIFLLVFVFVFLSLFVSVFAERNRSGVRTYNSSLLPWNVADPGLSCDKHDGVSDIGRTKICFSNHTRYLWSVLIPCPEDQDLGPKWSLSCLQLQVVQRCPASVSGKCRLKPECSLDAAWM